MTTIEAGLLRRGCRLEHATLGWNLIGVVVLAVGAISAGSVALAGFGLDSLEIGANPGPASRRSLWIHRETEMRSPRSCDVNSLRPLTGPWPTMSSASSC